MSKVIDFPNAIRGLPSPTSAAAIADEVTAVELELARPQIAALKAQTRAINNANVEYAWHCFKKLAFWLFVAWLLAQFIGGAKAEGWTSRSYYGANGSFAGSSVK